MDSVVVKCNVYAFELQRSFEQLKQIHEQLHGEISNYNSEIHPTMLMQRIERLQRQLPDVSRRAQELLHLKEEVAKAMRAHLLQVTARVGDLRAASGYPEPALEDEEEAGWAADEEAAAAAVAEWGATLKTVDEDPLSA